jgi:hypothetical protein
LEKRGRGGRRDARIAEQVIERRPGNMAAIRAYALDQFAARGSHAQDLHFSKAMPFLKKSEDAWQTYLKFDSGNYIAWNNLAASRTEQALGLKRLSAGGGRTPMAGGRKRSSAMRP